MSESSGSDDLETLGEEESRKENYSTAYIKDDSACSEGMRNTNDEVDVDSEGMGDQVDIVTNEHQPFNEGKDKLH